MTTFSTSRQIPATPAQVYAAISDPERLARWWGPAGFTNSVSSCDFKEGGRWLLTMHGPDGKNFPNEYVFAEIQPSSRVVIRHVLKPLFLLTITLTPSAAGTLVSWAQAFESEETARKVEQIVVPGNEQNLDRLTAEVVGQRVAGAS